MTHPLVKKAEEQTVTLVTVLSGLADQRLEEIRPWFKSTFPGRKLKIIFGNGTEFITLGDGSRDAAFERRNEAGHSGAQTRRTGGFTCHYVIVVDPPKGQDGYCEPDYSLQPLAEALADIMDITNGYRDGLPNDFEIG